MTTERTIRLARTEDGAHCYCFAVDAFGYESGFRLSDAPDPTGFVSVALALWARWAERIPCARMHRLVAEAGEVRADGNVQQYRIAHLNGIVLTGEDVSLRFGAPVAWCDVPNSLPIALGPSATLVLVNFALNGVLSMTGMHVWPFSDAFKLFNTTTSPHPAQGVPDTDNGLPLNPASAFYAPPRDDLSFAVACRGEYWQRPFSAMYYVPYRNLRVDHTGPLTRLSGEHLFIDNLIAETEPCLGRASFIAQVSLRDGAELCLPCSTPLGANCDVAGLLAAVAGPSGRTTAGCICDPVEGQTYGYAPPLALKQVAPLELRGI